MPISYTRKWPPTYVWSNIHANLVHRLFLCSTIAMPYAKPQTRNRVKRVRFSSRKDLGQDAGHTQGKNKSICDSVHVTGVPDAMRYTDGKETQANSLGIDPKPSYALAFKSICPHLPPPAELRARTPPSPWHTDPIPPLSGHHFQSTLNLGCHLLSHTCGQHLGKSLGSIY